MKDFIRTVTIPLEEYNELLKLKYSLPDGKLKSESTLIEFIKEISARSRNVIKWHVANHYPDINITTIPVKDFFGMINIKELKKMRNLGEASYKEIENALFNIGINIK